MRKARLARWLPLLLPWPALAATDLETVVAANVRGCSGVPVSVFALDAPGAVDAGYAGRVVLNASISGNWTLSGGSGAFEFPAGDGQAAYTFAPGDAGRAHFVFVPSSDAGFTVSVADAGGLSDISRSVAAPSYTGESVQQGLWETRYTWTTNTNFPPALPQPPNLASADSIQLAAQPHVDNASHTGSRFSINWTGVITVPADGMYILRATVNEGARIELDGAAVIDEWTFYSWSRGTNITGSAVQLYAGATYDLTAFYFERWDTHQLDVTIERVGDPAGVIAIPDDWLATCTSLNPTIPAPLAWYRMDEASWSGSSADVIDAIGGFHGTAGGGMSPDDVAPALNGTSGSCGYGDVPFDDTLAVRAGLRTGVNMANDIGNSGTLSFWYRAPTAWNNGSVRRTLIDASENAANGALFYLGLAESGSLVLRLRRTNGVIDTHYSWTTYTIAANQWANVVIQWNFAARRAKLAVYDTSGNLIGSVSNLTLANNIDIPNATVSIGDNAATVANEAWPFWWTPVAGGQIDEVRIYQGELSATEMNVLPRLRHRCGAPDHFAISHAGTGVNCEPASVTIRVHAEDDTMYSAYTGTVNLSTSTNHGDWSLASGSGVLANGGNGSGSYTFAAADSGVVTLRLANTVAEGLSINLSGGGIAEAADEDPVLTFVPAGFVVTSSDASGDVPLQISGKPSDTGYAASSLALKAVRTDDDSGACAAIFDGDVDVNVAAACIDPVSCGSVDANVNAATVTASPSATPSFVPVTFTFDPATFSAPLVFDYEGAGELQLLFDYALDASNAVEGASNPFVVRPFALLPEVPGNPAATDATGAAFKSAGSNFKARVRAVAWQAVDDSDANGIPDGHDDSDIGNNANLADNASVSNYGAAGAAETTALLTSNLVLPAGGTAPALAGSTEFASYTGGLSPLQDVHFDEAGIVELKAAPKAASYLGLSAAETAKISARSGPVGRFHAHHLITEVRHHGCSDADTFTYSGQAIEELYVEARNAAGATLANYAWNSTLGNSFSRNLSFSDAGSSSPGTFVNGSVDASDLAAGSVSVSDVAFRFSAVRLPYLLQVRATDADGATSKDHAEGSTSVRAGRLVIDGAFSPVFVPTNANVRVESWRVLSASSNGWDVETQDACTSLSLASGDVALDLFTGGVTPFNVSATALTLSGGSGRLSLSAPGPGNAGTLRATLGAPSWLEFEWNGAGAEDPAATIKYLELFEGNQRVIYANEVL